MSTPYFDKLLSKLREQDGANSGAATNITGLVYGNGSVLSAATAAQIRTAGGVGEVLADVTLDADDLPTYSGMTADATADTITFPAGTVIANGDAFYFEGPDIPAGLPAYVNEYTGAVGYLINVSGSGGATPNANVSLTRGGAAAVDIIDTGTAGWTARCASLQSYIISGIALGNGDIFEASHFGGVGWKTSGVADGYCSQRMNGDTTAGRHRFSSSENTSFGSGGQAGNIHTETTLCGKILGTVVGGTIYRTVIYGTDSSGANSTAVAASPITVFYTDDSTVGVTSITFTNVLSNAVDYKLGTRFIVRRLMKGL